jgi:hypothetical protein
LSELDEFDPSIFDVIRDESEQPSRAESRIDTRPVVNHDIKTPHQSLDAEMSVLGCMLLDAAGADAGLSMLAKSDFHSDLHRHVYSVISEQRQSGFIPDIITVASELASRRILPSEQDAAVFLLPILERVVHSANVASYAYIVREKAVRRAATYAIRETMSRLDDPSTSLDEILAEASSTIATVSESVSFNAKPQFNVMTSSELDAADIRTVFLVTDLLVKDQPCILAGAKKCLKTNAAIDLALSLGSGSKVMNRFYVPKAVRVALMSGESGAGTIQETARRIAKTKPWINLADYENNIWSNDLPRLGRPETKRDLIKFIRDNALDVLIVDPAYLCLDLGDDAGNLFKVGPKLMELTEVMAETGSTIVLIHHCKKGTNDPFGIPELENISWAGFQEWARQWILLNRRERYDPEQSGIHKLWMTVGGSAGHSGGWALDINEGSRNDPGGRQWDVSVQPISAAIAETIENRETEKEERARIKADKQLAVNSEKLIKAIRQRPDGDTAKSYRESAGLSGTAAARAFNKLLADELIEQIQILKSGHVYDAFRPTTKPAGLTGTDRDTTGTNPACPDGEHGAGLTPYRGSPGPAHRDIEQSLFETASGFSPGAEGRPA